MPLTPAQAAVVKADILATPELNAFPNNTDGAFAIAALYNLAASPAWWVWRTSVTKAEYVGSPSAEATAFSWTGTGGFIGRSVGEQAAWSELFNGTNSVNPSLANVRQAFADIFSGNGAAAVSNRTHMAAMSKRTASRIEKLLATGTGSLAVPATMGFVGDVSYQDINEARNS
jgi:hypothetical protein